MRLSLGKNIKVNMGNYEHVEVSAHVTLDGADLYAEDELADIEPDELNKELRDTALRYMDDYLEPELKRLAALSQATDTMLMPPAAPRRERTTRRRSTS